SCGIGAQAAYMSVIYKGQRIDMTVNLSMETSREEKRALCRHCTFPNISPQSCSQSSLCMMLIRPPGSYTVERHKQVFLTREKGFERKSHMEQQDKIHATAVNPTWRSFS